MQQIQPAIGGRDNLHHILPIKPDTRRYVPYSAAIILQAMIQLLHLLSRHIRLREWQRRALHHVCDGSQSQQQEFPGYPHYESNQ